MTTLTTQEPVKLDLALVVSQLQLAEDPVDAFQNELKQLAAEESLLKAEKKELLGIEQVRCDQINKRLAAITNRRAVIAGEQKDLMLKRDFLRKGYNTWMSLAPLRWRNSETGMPLFALFSPDEPIMTITTEERSPGWIFTNPEYPGPILSSYNDLAEAIVQYAQQSLSRWDRFVMRFNLYEYTIKAGFSGTIPASTRGRIRAAKESRAFSDIFILAEVGKWEVDAVAMLKVDPLVVGYCKDYPDRLWYIDSFDITPLENTLPLSME